MLDGLFEFFTPNRGLLPNKFTLAMGRRIRTAREEAMISQTAFAASTCRRQATLSATENRRMEVDASTLVILAAVLDKAVTYFFPPWSLRGEKVEGLRDDEAELSSLARQLSTGNRRKVIAQTRAVVEIGAREATPSKTPTSPTAIESPAQERHFMDEEELQYWKKKFEEMGIRFICENQSGVGPQVGGFLETTIDNQGRIWHAIDGSVPDNLKATLHEVLIWVASKGL